MAKQEFLGQRVISISPGSRRIRTYRDQHEREWVCNWDKGAGGPVGMIEPKGWSAPFIPPSRYLHPDDDTNRLWIDYDGLIADRRAAAAEYRQQAVREGQRLQGQAFNADAPISDQVLQIIGSAPESHQPWLACKQGNKFALGFKPDVDPRLKRYLPVPKEEIVYADDEDFSEPKRQRATAEA